MEKVFRYHKLAVALLLAASLSFPAPMVLAAVAEPEAFERAYELYLSNQYAKAIEAFDRFLEDFPKSTAADSVYFWKAKTLLNLKKEEEARQLFAELAKRFPDSPYRKIAERDFIASRPKEEDRARPAEDPAKKSSRVVVVGSQERKIKELEEERDSLKEQVSSLQQKQLMAEKGITRAMKDQEDNDRTQKAQLKKISDLESEKRILSDENTLLKLRAEDAEARLRKAPPDGRVDAPAGAQHDAPLVRIGDRKFTSAQVLRSIVVSSRVLSKLKEPECPWRRNGALESFILEQKLLAVAASQGVTADPGQVSSMTKQHSFDRDEAEYLANFLTIDRLVRQRLNGQPPSEQEARKYYEKNREAYRVIQPDSIGLLSIRYDADSELERGLLAVQIRMEALGGTPLEELARKHPEALYRVQKINDLPDWIQGRLSAAKQGGLSEIFSTGQEYLFLNAVAQKPGYRSYEEVRDEILRKLQTERTQGRDSLASWFADLAKDGVTVGEIR